MVVTRVLHLIDSGGLYGAEKMLLTLVREQIAVGLSPLILSAGEPGMAEKPLETEARRLGLPVESWRMKPGFNPSEALRILRWARERGYELLHSHGYKFNVLMGMWPQSVRRLPMVATLHGYVKAARFSKSWLYESLDRVILGRLNRVIVVSDAMMKDIPEGLSRSSRTSVIPNGLDIDGLRQAAGQPLPAGFADFIATHSPVLLGVGRLSREKGFERLVAAFASLRADHPEAGLLIIGEGKERAALARQAQQVGVAEALMMPGYSDAVPALMQAVDAICLPSYTEGLPITLLEAMALDVPVIASDVGEMAAVLGNGEGGFVVRLDRGEDLREAVDQCLAAEVDRQARVAWARERVSRDYSGQAMGRLYLSAYEQVAS